MYFIAEQARGAAECERIRAKLALAGVAHGARLVEATQKALIPPREKSRAELLQSLVPTTTTYGDRLSRRPSAPQANKNGKKGWFGNDVRISKIQIIISALAALYIIWAIITLYR